MRPVLLGIAIVIALSGISVGVYMVQQKEVTEKKVYRVGVLSGLPFFASTTDGFKDGMAEYGYVEGETIVYDVREVPRVVGNEAVLQEFVDAKVDLIVAFPTEPSIEAKQVTAGTGIPVISSNAVLENTGIVANFQEPGGNVTGVRYPGPEAAVQRLQIMREMVPDIRKVLIPHLKDYPTVSAALPAVLASAEKNGIEVIAAPFTAPDELATYLAERGNDIDAILTIAEPISVMPNFQKVLYDFADAHNIPVGGSAISADGRGSIFMLAPDAYEMGKLAAPLADKIFDGIDPGTIPVVTPNLHLWFSVSAAQDVGITLSPTLLGKAQHILK